MHKSIIIFLGLLVVLLPFGTSMNIFSNAMALNIVPSMNNDEQDYLQKYEKFYKDNSFRETYYNYHKQHHHQQEQQQQQQNQESRYNDNYDDMKNHLITITTTMMINPKIMSLERKLNVIISM